MISLNLTKTYVCDKICNCFEGGIIMITNKELGYVSTWANKAPYPGIDYANKAVEKLIEAFNNYNKFYSGKEYDIVLSNGEEILFAILSMNLCHMLGIDYKNLSGDYFDSFRRKILPEYQGGSYNLLKAIIDNIDDVLKYDYDNGGKILNYYRILIKCSIFDKLSDFSEFNFCVINFDKDKYFESSKSEYNGRSTKFFYVQSNEAVSPYFMMGLVPTDKDSSEELNIPKYAVETLIAPTNTKDFFNGQEVSIPTQILVNTDSSMDRLEATPSEKIALLNQYKTIISNYGLKNNINIQSDYESMLVESSRVKTRTL